MSATPTHEVTQLLAAWSEGDRSALTKLLPLVEGELHRLAHRYMVRERKDHTLQTTALVNEAYLKLIDQNVQWQNRAHFFGIAAQIMRRILIDHARQHLGPRHGGGNTISLEEAAVVSDERAQLHWSEVRVRLPTSVWFIRSASHRFVPLLHPTQPQSPR